MDWPLLLERVSVSNLEKSPHSIYLVSNKQVFLQLPLTQVGSVDGPQELIKSNVAEHCCAVAVDSYINTLYQVHYQ